MGSPAALPQFLSPKTREAANRLRAAQRGVVRRRSPIAAAAAAAAASASNAPAAAVAPSAAAPASQESGADAAAAGAAPAAAMPSPSAPSARLDNQQAMAQQAREEVARRRARERACIAKATSTASGTAPGAAAPAAASGAAAPAARPKSLVGYLKDKPKCVWLEIAQHLPADFLQEQVDQKRLMDRELNVDHFEVCITTAAAADRSLLNNTRKLFAAALVLHAEAFSDCAIKGDATRHRFSDLAFKLGKELRAKAAAPAALDSRGGIVSATLGADGHGGEVQPLKDFTKSVSKARRAASHAAIDPAAPAAGRPTAGTPATTGKRPRPVEATPAAQRTAPASTTSRRTTARGQSVAEHNASAAAARAAPAAGMPSAAKRPRNLFQ